MRFHLNSYKSFSLELNGFFFVLNRHRFLLQLDPSGILDSLLEVKKTKKVPKEGASDVPTRVYLKRQSQLYVEAVTRRKGFQQKAQSADKK